jgi:hypothetical protein
MSSEVPESLTLKAGLEYTDLTEEVYFIHYNAQRSNRRTILSTKISNEIGSVLLTPHKVNSTI